MVIDIMLLDDVEEPSPMRGEKDVIRIYLPDLISLFPENLRRH